MFPLSSSKTCVLPFKAQSRNERVFSVQLPPLLTIPHDDIAVPEKTLEQNSFPPYHSIQQFSNIVSLSLLVCRKKWPLCSFCTVKTELNTEKKERSCVAFACFFIIKEGYFILSVLYFCIIDSIIIFCFNDDDNDDISTV